MKEASDKPQIPKPTRGTELFDIAARAQTSPQVPMSSVTEAINHVLGREFKDLQSTLEKRGFVERVAIALGEIGMKALAKDPALKAKFGEQILPPGSHRTRAIRNKEDAPTMVLGGDTRKPK